MYFDAVAGQCSKPPAGYTPSCRIKGRYAWVGLLGGQCSGRSRRRRETQAGCARFFRWPVARCRIAWASMFLLGLTEGRHVPNAAQSACQGPRAASSACPRDVLQAPKTYLPPGGSTIAARAPRASRATAAGTECFDAKNNFISKFPFCSSCPRPLKTAANLRRLHRLQARRLPLSGFDSASGWIAAARQDVPTRAALRLPLSPCPKARTPTVADGAAACYRRPCTAKDTSCSGCPFDRWRWDPKALKCGEQHCLARPELHGQLRSLTTLDQAHVPNIWFCRIWQLALPTHVRSNEAELQRRPS
jgi:hypothetical protein